MADLLLATKMKAGDLFGSAAIVKAIRGIAQDNARNRIEVARTGFADMIDSSAGTAGATTALVAVPAKFTVTATDAAPKAGFDTAMGKSADAAAVLGDYLNPILSILGLEQIVLNTGAISTVGTVPAQDLTLTAVTGGSNGAVEQATARAQISVARNNQATLIRAINRVAVAIGDEALADWTGGAPDKSTHTLVSEAATASGVDGTSLSTLADSVVDAILTVLANNYATMLAHLNQMLFQTGVADLTVSVGGTVSDAVPVVATLTAYQDGTTDSAPKAGFDTQVAIIETNMSDAALRINILAARYGVTLLTDSTGASPNTTMAAQATGLTAVDGTASNSLEVVSAQTTLDAITNNLATLLAKINELIPYFGVNVIVDSSGGTVSTVDTVVNVPASGAGVDNGAAVTGVADSQMDAVLVVLRNAMTSVGGKLNELTGTLGSQAATKPLKVVATN